MSRLLRIAGVSLAAAAVIGSIGRISYRHHVRKLERDMLGELAAIRTLKVEHVRAWRETLRRDAELVRTIPALITFAAADTRSHHGGHLAEVIDWIRRNYEPRGYREIRVLSPLDPAPDWSGVPALVAAARRGGGPLLSQFFRTLNDDVRLAIVAPVPRVDHQPSGFVLVLTVDPGVLLAPAFQTWPSSSPSGESLLVRRDGDEVVYLNDVRHMAATRLRLRRPVADRTLPAARAFAAAEPESGTKMNDYRGVQVLAAFARVPDSDWAVVTKIDAAEVYAPLRALAVWTWLALGSVVAAGIALALWGLERRQTAIYKQAASARLVEERLGLAVRASGVGLWDWDVVRNVVYFSPEYKAQLGYAEHELISSFAEWEDRLHPDDRERAVAYARDFVTAPAGEFCQEFRLRHRDGSYRHILARAQARPENGRIVRLLGCHVDLTQLKQLDAQFREAQKMEAVGRLAGGIAHDFNNLLTVINGYVDLLLIGELPPEMARDLREVQRAAQSAARLTRQLLVFSRGASDARTVTDLNALLREWQKLLRRTLGDDVIVRLELAPGAAWILAAVSQVEQAVMNLAVNARDAMPDGGTLVIRTARREIPSAPAGGPDLHPGEYWIVSVEDTGTGIPDDVLPHIFEPFFTTKTAGRGTGLGLAMVYGVATSCEGAVCVQTSPNGTTFSMYFPVAAAPEPEIRAPQPAVAQAAPKRVLIVDDDPVVRGVLARIITRGGHVAEAADPVDALAACTGGEQFDVLVSDVMMPGVSGVELARRLIAVHPGLRIVFMTGYPGGELGDRVPDDAVVLRKPPTPEDLINAIDAAPPVAI